ncbi:MAG: VCBS repeat-containing protein, partial [Thermoplasmata archaeon]|nr:VCBS repeat-containing protein [Thermoplasmata archaeon]
MRKITTFVTILVLVLMTFAAMPMNVSAEGDDMWSPVSNPTTSGLYKAINAVDIDGDGLDELLAGYAAYGNSKIEIWSYDPDTDTWTKDQTLGPPSSGYWADPHAIEPADLDNDGDLDLIVPTRGAGTYVFWNEGGGVWSDSKIDWSYGWSADVGDIDQDGNLDILLNTIPVLKIYYGDGQRGFTAGVCPESSYTAGMWGAYLVDMNNDGFLDLVASIMWGYEGFLRVYHYNGNRQWSADSGPGHTPIRSFLYTGDINEDGRVDIVTTVFRDINANDIDIYYQTEMGGWNKVPTINVPGESLDFPWVGDINKDGHLDIV